MVIQKISPRFKDSSKIHRDSVRFIDSESSLIQILREIFVKRPQIQVDNVPNLLQTYFKTSFTLFVVSQVLFILGAPFSLILSAPKKIKWLDYKHNQLTSDLWRYSIIAAVLTMIVSMFYSMVDHVSKYGKTRENTRKILQRIRDFDEIQKIQERFHAR